MQRKIRKEEIAMNVADILTKPLQIASAILDRDVARTIHKLKFSNPEPITREEAIEAIAESKWARNWAASMLRLAGVSPMEPDYEERLEELARKVAEKVV